MERKGKDNLVSPPPVRVGSIRNIGEPLRFANVEPLIGFATEAGRAGENVKVCTKLSTTSDEPIFHQLVQNLSGVIDYMAQAHGVAVNLRRADTVLLVLKPDATAELWIDTAAVVVRCAIKRQLTAGSVVFESDIADITGMNFPDVLLDEQDKVLCIFRVDWRFGLYFDFNPSGKLDREEFISALGELYREMRYWHLYDAISRPAFFERLIKLGWFPFAEIITAEFPNILRHCEAGFDVAEIEDGVVAAFDDARLQRIVDRWISKPHFASKAEILRAAITAFRNHEPIPTIKILLTEIEGVLNDAFRATHNGQGAKLEKLLRFAEEAAEKKAGSQRTLFFPKAFGQYLRQHTFSSFNPALQKGTASSRNAVGHGAADPSTYTMPRALQAILTLDQLAFYT